MSCGQPSQEEAEADTIPILPPPSTTCVRCGQPPKIIVRATAWCHDCFLASFQGRFRKSLEGAKTVSKPGFDAYVTGGHGSGGGGKNVSDKEKPLSKVVLAFSGGSSSRAMLELFKTSYFKQPDLEDPESAPVAATPVGAVSGGQGENELKELGEKKKDKKKKKGPKKQFFPPAFASGTVVFVDESELPEYGPDRTEEIRQIVESTTPFEFVAVKLSDIFADPSLGGGGGGLSTMVSSPLLPAFPTKTPPARDASPLDRLRALFFDLSSFSSSSSSSSSPRKVVPATNYATLHSTLVQTLVLHQARKLSADVLLFGDNSTRLGIKTISNMSQGRGWSLGEEISIEHVSLRPRNHGGLGGGQEEEAEEKVLVCRPMGQALAKEVAYYTESEGLDTVTITNEDTSQRATSGHDAGGGGSIVVEKDIKKVGIGKLVEDFVLNLEAQFPSTVSIITKTAHKLGMRSADAGRETKNLHLCALCEMPAQVNAEGWNRAITISDLESARSALASSRRGGAAASASGATLIENRTPRTTTTTTKRREPYQPSKNHLLEDPLTRDRDGRDDTTSNAVSGSETTTTMTTMTTRNDDPPRASSSFSPSSSFDLSNELCYGCLLVMQTMRPASSSGGGATRKKKASVAGSPSEEDESIVGLPAYVFENVERRRRQGHRLELEDDEDTPVHTKVVMGREGIKDRIKDFLLDDEDAQ